MTPEFWLDVVWKCWTIALTIYVAINRSQDKLSARISAVEKDMVGLGDRLQKLQGDVKALPSVKDIAELHDKINGAANDLSHLIGKQDSNDALLRTIHQYLINNKNRDSR